MRVAKFLPFVALAAVLVALLATSVWHEDVTYSRPYESPCIVSWDENDGDSTLCVLTQRAAAMEHQLARQRQQ
jgi:hypothetical protein